MTTRFVWLVVLLLVSVGSAVGEVVRVEIEKREPFAEGMEFGHTGAYEVIAGRLFYEVDPRNDANERITDLELAPPNAHGRVEFWEDFFLLQPIDPGKGNGCLLYDVHNRGNKLALWTFNDGEMTNDPHTAEHAGNGFLFREGYSVLWTGWNGEVQEDGTNRLLAGLPIARQPNGEAITGRNYVEISVDEAKFSQPFYYSIWGTSKAYPAVSLDNSDAVLTKRRRRSEPAEEIPRDGWAFAEMKDGELVPDATSLYVKEGFRPGWIYELVYTARDPRVSGLGLAGLRDAVSFLRFGTTGNPSLGRFDRACIFGISQSGRLIHHFLYEGFNRDEADRKVFDGAIIHVAGAGKGLFNQRFGMATVYATEHNDNLIPSEFFPFSPTRQTDPVTGQSGDSLERLRESGTVPKVFFVQTSTEYWTRAASLLHTDLEGKTDLPIDENVRIYSVAGAQHLGGGPTDPGICQFPRNPLNDRGPVLRALLVAMDGWMREAASPPESRYPRIDDGTLVNLETYRSQFPEIPGVNVPPASYQPLRLDPGPRWRSEGIADNAPPKVGEPYRTLVPAIDADGNELAGIRLPEVAVPIASYMGWNLRDEAYGVGGILAGLHGGYHEFPLVADPKDSRAAVRDRYPNRETYLSQFTEATLALWRDGFLLAEDAQRLLQEASERRLWD